MLAIWVSSNQIHFLVEYVEVGVISLHYPNHKYFHIDVTGILYHLDQILLISAICLPVGDDQGHLLHTGLGGFEHTVGGMERCGRVGAFPQILHVVHSPLEVILAGELGQMRHLLHLMAVVDYAYAGCGQVQGHAVRQGLHKILDDLEVLEPHAF